MNSYILIIAYILIFVCVNVICNINDNIKICEEKNENLIHRLERLERIFNITQFNPDLDNVSILELLFANLQDKLSRMIPDTDDICKFNWVTGKCNPKCLCGYKPKLGDYLPSRSCRLLSNEEIDLNCDNAINDIPWMIKVSNKTKDIIESIQHMIQQNAPKSDDECIFSWKNLKCVPEHMCKMNYKLGDYSINRVCRLRYGDTYNDDEEESNLNPASLGMDHSQSDNEESDDDIRYDIDETELEDEDDNNVGALI